jgi:AraC family transcriptional regulator, transcriptional activator of the genes for pyochelin and ferripyochelin receptors
MNDIPELKIIDWYADNIRLTHTISHYKKADTFSISNQDDVVRLHFGLKGNYNFSYKQLNKRFELIGGHHNLMYSKGFDIVLENKSATIETFGIQFPKDAFIRFTQGGDDTMARFSEDIINGNNTILSDSWGTLRPEIEYVIHQILHCPYDHTLKDLFLLSKTLELLVLSVQAHATSKQKRPLFLKKKSDKEKVIAARDMINENLTNPPSLSDVAKTTGLNEYKLKRGFKELFETTVFNYLTNQRLNLALEYLKQSSKTSAEIAFELGYKTPQHFNNAFKKKFGTTPNLVRNNPN